MMKTAVMISIQPKWCSLIVAGRKTLELRKSKPKLKLPFKCYIYMTKGFASYRISHDMWLHNSGGMCVIGEFVCDGFLSHCEMANADIAEAQSLVRREKILEYAGEKEVFGWHISDLVIYDKPKMFGDFYVEKDATTDYPMLVKMKRPPQSWCYVEELEEKDGDTNG